MAFYDYKCLGECKKTYEERQPITAPPLVVCKHCGGKLKRLIGTPMFVVTGEGIYSPGYK